MHRAKKLRNYWSLLPTFRVVAETQSITKSALRLGLSPSAVSRAVAQLESALEVSLFHRIGKRLTLAPRGEALLLSVRTAMRTVDDGAERLGQSSLGGPLIVAVCEPWTSALLGPTLRSLRIGHPAIMPSFIRLPEEKIVSALCRGTIDVAITRGFTLRPPIEATRLATFATAVYRRREGPRRPGDVSNCPFVELTGHWNRNAPWPADQPRAIEVYVEDYDLMLASLLGADLRGVLPKSLVVGPTAALLDECEAPSTGDIRTHLLCRAATGSDGLAHLFREVALDVAQRFDASRLGSVVASSTRAEVPRR